MQSAFLLLLGACQVANTEYQKMPNFRLDPKEESFLESKVSSSDHEDRSSIQSVRRLDSMGTFIGSPANLQIEMFEEGDSGPPAAMLKWEYDGKVSESLRFAIEGSSDSEEGPYTLLRTVSGEERSLDGSREIFRDGHKFFKMFVFDEQYYSPDSDFVGVAGAFNLPDQEREVDEAPPEDVLEEDSDLFSQK